MKVILRFMGRLQKLKSLIKLNNLFHYKFIIPKDLFYQLKIKTYFIENNNDYIICYGTKKLYEQLEIYDIKIINQYKSFFKTIFLKRIVMILTAILVLSIFYSSSLFIREITFKDPSMYDYRVYDYVYKKLDKRLFLYTLKEDINKISLSLRAAFPNYAYVGITKNGSSLEIDIEKINVKKNDAFIKNEFPIISNYNAVIYGISCTDGVVLVNLNQSVKKGDSLVIPNQKESFCEAVILGKLSEYKTIIVKKKRLCYGYTGKIIKKMNLKVGKNYLMKFKNYYTDQDIRIIENYSLFDYLYVVDTYYYEKDFLLVEYDYETAFNYAISMFYADLEINRKSSLEKINNIILLNFIEHNDEFIFNFLVNEIKSIGIYAYN